MKLKILENKRKILRTIYGTLSFSTALFVFQACYGTREDFGSDVSIQGMVKSTSTNQPIPGIRVSVENQPQYEITDNEGKFKIFTSKESAYKIKFEDIDSTQNGKFLPKDTVLKVVDETTYLNISLDVQ